jgi:hypothetical protein
MTTKLVILWTRGLVCLSLFNSEAILCFIWFEYNG